MKVAILGAGTFGTTLAQVAIDNKTNEKVWLWSYSQEEAEALSKTRVNRHLKDSVIDENIIITSDIDVVNQADVILFVVPSFALRQTAQLVNSVLTDSKIVVVATKGLEAETMKSGHDIIKEEITKLQANVILSGPTHAEELAMRMFTTIVSTSTDKEARDLVSQMFTTDYLRVYKNDDVRGVEILGAAKNVLAIAAGFCDGSVVFGDNAKAALLTRGLRELLLLGQLEGCKTETFYGLTGLGDLMVTANSKYSRNRRFGELLGSGLTKEEAQIKIDMVVEGLYSVQAIHKMKVKSNLDLPIIEMIYQVLFEDVAVEDIVKFIENRSPKDE